MPDTGVVFTTDVTLSQLAIGPTQNRYLADEIAPMLNSGEKTALIYRIDPEEDARRNSDDIRAPGAEAKPVGTDADRPITFNAVDHAYVGYVPDEHRAVSNPAIQASIDEVMRIVDRIKVAKEIRLEALINLELTGAQTSVPSIKWDVVATGTPIADILAEIDTVETGSGASPNILVCDQSVIRGISKTDEYLDRVKHTSLPTENSTAINLAAILGLEQVITSKINLKNTAIKGQTATLARIWADNALLFFREAPSMKTRNFAQQMVWTSGDLAGGAAGGLVNGFRVEQFRAALRRSDGFVVSQYYDFKLLNEPSAHYFTDTLT